MPQMLSEVASGNAKSAADHLIYEMMHDKADGRKRTLVRLAFSATLL